MANFWTVRWKKKDDRANNWFQVLCTSQTQVDYYRRKFEGKPDIEKFEVRNALSSKPELDAD